MFERFTASAREAIVQAQHEANALHHRYLGTEHVLLGITLVGGPAARVLERFSIDADVVRVDVERMVGLGSTATEDDDAEALRTLGIDLDEVRRRVEQEFGPGALDRPPAPCRRHGMASWSGGLPFTPRAKNVLELALREAERMRMGFIGTEHVLLGIVREKEGLAARILDLHGASPDEVRSALADELAGSEGLDGTSA